MGTVPLCFLGVLKQIVGKGYEQRRSRAGVEQRAQGLEHAPGGHDLLLLGRL